MNKNLENKESLKLINVKRLPSNDQIVLEYYLFESELEGSEENINTKAYGVEIIKNINEKFAESESIRNYSIYKKSTLDFLDKLSRNTVSPVGLTYVFDDISGI